MVPFIILGAAIVGAGSVIRMGALATATAVAGARERKLRRAESLDLNEKHETEVSKEMGLEEPELIPLQLRPATLPPSLQEFAGNYLLTPRDLVVLTYAVTSEQARTKSGRIGKLVTALAKVSKTNKDTLERELYCNVPAIQKSLPALLRSMKRASAARFRSMQQN